MSKPIFLPVGPDAPDEPNDKTWIGCMGCFHECFYMDWIINEHGYPACPECGSEELYVGEQPDPYDL